MRIAIDGRYIQDHFPGIARYTYNLIENLGELVEDEVTVYHNPALLNTRYVVQKLERPGRIKLHQLDLATFSVWEQVRLPWILAGERVEVFHSPYYIKPYVQPCRSVVTVYDTITTRYPQYMLSRQGRIIFELATRLAVMSARKIITLSQSSKRDLVRLYGAKPEKIAVTYLAADERYRPRDKATLPGLREKYGLPERFVLYVGINKPHKNLACLIEAFAEVNGDPAVKLVLAGKEDRRYPEARRAAERSGLGERIVFLGDIFDGDLPGIYNLAEVFAFPSQYEGFGLPPLEAMASGVPVLCSNASSLPEVVGDAALLFDPGDVTELAAALERVLEDSKLQEELAAKGLQRARTFSWRETARQTLEIYGEAAGR